MPTAAAIPLMTLRRSMLRNNPFLASHPGKSFQTLEKIGLNIHSIGRSRQNHHELVLKGTPSLGRRIAYYD